MKRHMTITASYSRLGVIVVGLFLVLGYPLSAKATSMNGIRISRAATTGGIVTSSSLPLTATLPKDQLSAQSVSNRSSATTAAIAPAVFTEQCGEITSNTIWTTASDPYIVTCDLTVASTAILKIEAGVIVKF